jgi:putative ABC transport system permease protein
VTTLRLILRNLAYFRWVNAAVVAGVAVATAVLSGALMVGDSVRGSLVDLAVRRLGRIDHALLATRFFDASLAQRLNSDPSIKDRFEIVPAIIVRGGISGDSSGARTAGVQIVGIGGEWVPIRRGECILNSEAAEALGIASPGVDVVLSVPAESDIPRDSPLARRARQDTLSGLRVRVASIAREPGMLALFSPAGGQRAPQNAWVHLADLQEAVGQNGRVNTLFVHGSSRDRDGADQLNKALRGLVTPADYGLTVAKVTGGAEAALTSRATYIDPPIESAADASGVPIRKIGINLINAVNRLAADGGVAARIHYAVAAGITPLDQAALADDEIALNTWAAAQLGAKVGDQVSLAFYRRQFDGGLAELSDADRGFANHFRVARILPMSGIGADPSLTPAYKGLTDADSIANWDPPAEVKIDKKLVTPADEEYWKQHKAAPKLFVSFATARRLWGTGLGDATSLRVPAGRADEFVTRLLAGVDPATMGMSFRPLRAEQIAAASGTTDFGQLFIGFSFFLIVAAALLVAMLLRLSVEQRGRQLGAMAALGFSPKSLRRIMLIEGMLLSIVGGIIGTLLAVGYTWLMMAGLRTWWIGAIGTTAMRLHVVPRTLALGFILTQVVALLAILWAVRQVGRAVAARLLAGGFEATRTVQRSDGRIIKALAGLGWIVGLASIAAGMTGMMRQQDAFLVAGTILLASGLCWLGAMLRPRRRARSTAGPARSVARLGVLNATRHTARSVLCIGLIALAAFALVTVASMRQGEPADTGDRRSGSGGYQLIIESDIPLLGNPATKQGRELLGFREYDNPIWDRVEFLPLRRKPGQDISCLNLTQATNPSIVAAPASLHPGGPLDPLSQPDPSGAIPVMADESTATYILHLKIGQTIDIHDASGTPRALRLVGMLHGSIFQSELLMSEENFRGMFPANSGFGVLLVRAGPEDLDQVRRLLSDELAEYGASVRTTASVLEGYLQIQNTYLSTFQLLGALGLMLGTIGLAVVLVRTVIERKSELALLSAIGFARGARMRLVLAENALLLVSGLVLGAVCALIGVLPALRESARQLHFTSLGVTLVGVLVTGLCASGIAVVLSSGRIGPADLRSE